MTIMKAIKLTKKCEAKDLIPVLVTKPTLKKGYVLIKVKAFGVNESEVTSRKGESSSDFTFPRILGIEGVGVVEKAPKGSRLKPGQKVATMMGGMGRRIDGSYAEYMLVKEKNVIPIKTDLDWSIIGALPEMLQTAYGSLSEGLRLEKGDRLLIRGGSSTVGLMAIILAKLMGAYVIATTRNEKKVEELKEQGADCVIMDNKEFKKNMKKVGKIDKVLELVGCSTLFEDLSFLKQGGYGCFTGALAGQWNIKNFSPYMIPTGIFLTSYAGEATDLPAKIFNDILRKIAKNEIKVPIAKVYDGLSQVGQAQLNLESGKYLGKHVVVL
ncbi:zinc-binding dehydrogenase [Lactobacillus sp. PSON]|uniref:zinc-binding dehydrogenase n=1 Tax=Lactobacillus sp. PSON TaxID=3455454 RepID=UPI004041549D